MATPPPAAALALAHALAQAQAQAEAPPERPDPTRHIVFHYDEQPLPGHNDPTAAAANAATATATAPSPSMLDQWIDQLLPLFQNLDNDADADADADCQNNNKMEFVKATAVPLILEQGIDFYWGTIQLDPRNNDGDAMVIHNLLYNRLLRHGGGGVLLRATPRRETETSPKETAGTTKHPVIIVIEDDNHDDDISDEQEQEQEPEKRQPSPSNHCNNPKAAAAAAAAAATTTVGMAVTHEETTGTANPTGAEKHAPHYARDTNSITLPTVTDLIIGDFMYAKLVATAGNGTAAGTGNGTAASGNGSTTNTSFHHHHGRDSHTGDNNLHTNNNDHHDSRKQPAQQQQQQQPAQQQQQTVFVAPTLPFAAPAPALSPGVSLSSCASPPPPPPPPQALAAATEFTIPQNKMAQEGYHHTPMAPQLATTTTTLLGVSLPAPAPAQGMPVHQQRRNSMPQQGLPLRRPRLATTPTVATTPCFFARQSSTPRFPNHPSGPLLTPPTTTVQAQEQGLVAQPDNGPMQSATTTTTTTTTTPAQGITATLPNGSMKSVTTAPAQKFTETLPNIPMQCVTTAPAQKFTETLPNIAMQNVTTAHAPAFAAIQPNVSTQSPKTTNLVQRRQRLAKAPPKKARKSSTKIVAPSNPWTANAFVPTGTLHWCVNKTININVKGCFSLLKCSTTGQCRIAYKGVFNPPPSLATATTTTTTTTTATATTMDARDGSTHRPATGYLALPSSCDWDLEQTQPQSSLEETKLLLSFRQPVNGIDFIRATIPVAADGFDSSRAFVNSLEYAQEHYFRQHPQQQQHQQQPATNTTNPDNNNNGTNGEKRNYHEMALGALAVGLGVLPRTASERGEAPAGSTTACWTTTALKVGSQERKIFSSASIKWVFDDDKEYFMKGKICLQSRHQEGENREFRILHKGHLLYGDHNTHRNPNPVTGSFVIHAADLEWKTSTNSWLVLECRPQNSGFKQIKIIMPVETGSLFKAAVQFLSSDNNVDDAGAGKRASTDLAHPQIDARLCEIGRAAEDKATINSIIAREAVRARNIAKMEELDRQIFGSIAESWLTNNQQRSDLCDET